MAGVPASGGAVSAWAGNGSTGASWSMPVSSSTSKSATGSLCHAQRAHEYRSSLSSRRPDLGSSWVLGRVGTQPGWLRIRPVCLPYRPSL